MFTLFNGERSTVKSVFHLQAGGSNCSATLIGKNVAATAAHCFGQKSSGTASATGTIDGKTVSMTCTQSPSWPNANQDLDIAICKLSSEVTSIPSACVGPPPGINSAITLIGHGTSNKEDGEGFFDTEQRKGDSILRGTAGADGRPSHMRIQGNSVAGGPGDSGGFAGTKNADGKWILAGVIARSGAFERRCVPASRLIDEGGKLRCENGTSKVKTFFTNRGGTTAVSLQSAGAQAFLKDFSRTNGVDICGVDKSGGPGPGPTPGPTPLPPGTPLAKKLEARRNFRLGITPRTGISVLPNSPIAGAGLKSGDTITAVNGIPVRNLFELQQVVNQLKANPFVNQIRISAKDRSGNSRDMNINLPPVNSQADLFRRQFFRLGIALNRGNVGAGEVASGSVASQLGIQPGEVICRVNGFQVQSTNQLVQLVTRLRETLSVPSLVFTVGTGGCTTTRQVTAMLP